MPLERALSVGALKATGSIKLEAMPLTPAAIAWSNAVTIWDTLEVAEPVHSGLGCRGWSLRRPSRTGSA